MTALFPSTLPGFAFSVKKAPQFKTKIQKAISGRELRLTYQPVPTWLFTVRFEFLNDSSDMRQASDFGPAGWGSTSTDLRNLMGFFLSVQGSLTTFYLDDPTDDSVTNQFLGTGDGVSTVFQLIRSMGVSPNIYNEPIIAPDNVSEVFLNGVAQAPTSYSVNSIGILTFNSAPGNGVAITASFTYFFLCRMGDDTQEFEYFLYQLWSAEGLKLQSVLL